MAKEIKIKRGLDIPLDGKAEGKPANDTKTTLYGIVPDDYPGHVWKIQVKPGDEVKSGTPLFIDKESGKLALVSPVAGSVKEIKRGERRHILHVSIEKKGDTAESFDTAETPDSIRATLQNSGLWALMRQRPYDIVPDSDSTPRDIYITAIDSAPLAPEMLEDIDIPYLYKGVDILSKLTDGKVYLAVRPGSRINSPKAEMLEVSGPHPAGNSGVHIANTRPVNKGETVWTLSARTAARIGRLYSEGVADWQTVVAICGPKASDAHMVRTTVGAAASTLLQGNSPEGFSDIRVISGNVLTGVKISPEDGFLHYPYRQITLIEEGKEADEFMGWASLSPKKYSVKRSFPAFLRGLSKPYPWDARIKGGHRAMILSEEYDKVFPFDILPEYLLKAIMAKDIDRMEKLGIYEVAPEDFALPEFVDTSKQELQKIVREGLDYLRSEE